MARGNGGGEDRRERERAAARKKKLMTPGGDVAYMQRIETKVTRGKDIGMTKVSYKDIEAGAEGGFQFDEERAKDARNWEYWYKREHGTKPVTGSYRKWQGGKGGGEVRVSRQAEAIDAARREASDQGQDVYEIEQIQAETRKIQEASERRKKAVIGGKKFGSTRAATAVAASKQRAQRRTLGAQKTAGTGTGVFGTQTARDIRQTKLA